jgi:hypothetical protein
MTNIEAIKAFHEGRRIRLPAWHPSQFIVKGPLGDAITQSGQHTVFNLRSLRHDSLRSRHHGYRLAGGLTCSGSKR